MKRSLLALLFFLIACSRETKQQPNVLLITLDTFRADRLGARTPNLAKLAASGVKFDETQTPVPLTLPAHASILSGLLPLHHGLRNNGVGVFPSDRETLATALSRGGYRTGAFVGAFVLDHRFGLNRGFEVYDDEVVRDPEKDLTLEAERRGSEVVDRALQWLGAGDARPTFTWVHLWDAHAPYAPPAPHEQSYDGEAAYVDMQVGRLLAAIDRTKTIVVVVGDHGESLGEHGEATHGLLLYQSTLHVPMLIAAPEVQPRVVREAVSSVDLAPTVAALAGLDWPKVDGRDLFKDAPPTDLYAETQYPLTFGWTELSSLRANGKKLIAGGSPELYNLAGDPREQRNLAAEDRRTFFDLTAKLEALRATAVAATNATVDEETKAKLASLGYVAPAPVRGNGPRPDPKSMTALFVRFEKARDARAVNELQELVRKDPGNPVFRATLANVLRQRGASGDAVALFREAVALAPSDADAWYNLGVALTESGKRDEALAVLRESARLDPRRAATLNALGILHIEQGELPRAAETFQRAIELDPRDARGWNNLGNAARALGRAAEAIAAYQKAIQLAPRYADPHNGLGVLLVQQQRAAEAVASFDAALRLQPDHYEAQLNRGIALQESGNGPAAAAQYRALLEKLPPGRAHDAQRDAARTLLSSLSRSRQ